MSRFYKYEYETTLSRKKNVFGNTDVSVLTNILMRTEAIVKPLGVLKKSLNGTPCTEDAEGMIQTTAHSRIRIKLLSLIRDERTIIYNMRRVKYRRHGNVRKVNLEA